MNTPKSILFLHTSNEQNMNKIKNTLPFIVAYKKKRRHKGKEGKGGRKEEGREGRKEKREGGRKSSKHLLDLCIKN